MTNPNVKKLYGLDEFYDEQGGCLTCYKKEKKEGYVYDDIKCNQCIYYIEKKYSPTTNKGHCRYGASHAN